MKRTRAGVRLCLEPLEDRIVPSAPSEFQLTFATTTDSRTISVNYDISGSSLAGQTVNFNIYRSAGYKSLSGAQLIGTASIPGSDSVDLSVGMHQGVKLSLTAPNGQPLTALTPNPALPFIVVVANPGGTAPGSGGTNDIASFETHVLGVIAHGFEFDPFLLWTNQVPLWEMQMAADLLHIDGYQAVIPFNWVRLSILPFPGPIEIAGDMLYQQVVTEADQLASQHPGDVVDINFIGHSRGTVVISEVLQDLVGSNDPALRGGYMQMTLLDPHPANPLFSQFSFIPNISVAQDFAVLVFVVELLMRDPQVVVPANVLGVQEFDQQTPAGQLGFQTLDEILLNLWGELPSALPNQSSQSIRSQNLTNVTAPGIGLIGHEQVPDWYLVNVVDPDKTFDYFGG
jgi:hypothetical protein